MLNQPYLATAILLAATLVPTRLLGGLVSDLHTASTASLLLFLGIDEYQATGRWLWGLLSAAAVVGLEDARGRHFRPAHQVLRAALANVRKVWRALRDDPRRGTWRLTATAVVLAGCAAPSSQPVPPLLFAADSATGDLTVLGADSSATWEHAHFVMHGACRILHPSSGPMQPGQVVHVERPAGRTCILEARYAGVHIGSWTFRDGGRSP